MSAIELRSVGKRFGKRQVVSIGEYDIETGDLVQIVGRNGSGKSTLVRIMAGVSRASSGSVRFAQEVSGPIAYVPQRGGHYGELSLADNARLLSSVISPSGHSLLTRPDLIESFELGPSLDAPVRTLSEGMRRVVTFLCVWATRPKVILADEPLAGVDALNSARLVDLVVGNEIEAAVRVITSHVPQLPGRILDLTAQGEPDVAA
jgi:ABC-2 type transport system ATP-binding protein